MFSDENLKNDPLYYMRERMRAQECGTHEAGLLDKSVRKEIVELAQAVARKPFDDIPVKEYTPKEYAKLMNEAHMASYGHMPNRLYSHPTDAYPSLGWGFLLYAVRHHMHRAKQAQMARILGVRQEYVSRMERGQMKVPQTVKTYLVSYIFKQLAEDWDIEIPVFGHQPNRNVRQRDMMQAHGTFGGKGKTRTRKRAA